MEIVPGLRPRSSFWVLGSGIGSWTGCLDPEAVNGCLDPEAVTGCLDPKSVSDTSRDESC